MALKLSLRSLRGSVVTNLFIIFVTLTLTTHAALDTFSQAWAGEAPREITHLLSDKSPCNVILLHGPPGTGKTQFARYVATRLERDLMVKTASELQSMWIGEAEKNIARAFREAERDGAILFIDEADSFLFSRESAHRMWEVSQVNEFLCQMENFKGILICATDFVFPHIKSKGANHAGSSYSPSRRKCS